MTELYARMEKPENGFKSDSEKAKTLDPNTFYRVERIDMGGSYSTVFLKDVEDKAGFNTANFEFYVEDEEDSEKYLSYNVFADPAYNPYLSAFGNS